MTSAHHKRLYGTISLAIMALGTAIAVTFLALSQRPQPFCQVLATAFQAGLVGGLADWYAVHVLLHPAPWFMHFWPFAQHSNLLIRNRRKLEENIVVMVERELLSADKIWNHLGTHFEQLDQPAGQTSPAERNPWIARLLEVVREQHLADPLIDLLGSPSAVRLMRTIRSNVLQITARALRDPGHRNSLRQWIRTAAVEQLPGIEQRLLRGDNISAVVAWLHEQLDQPAVSALAARLCGDLLDDVVLGSVHEAFIEQLLRDLCNWMATAPAVRQGIRDVIDGSIANYRTGKSGLQQMVVDVVKQVAINRDKVVDSIVTELVRFLNRLEQEPSHPLRLQWNVYLLAYADSLRKGDKAMAVRFDALRKHLLTFLRPGLEKLIRWSSQTLIDHSTSNETQALIDQLADRLADWLEQAPTDDDKLPRAATWLKGRLHAALSDPQSAFWVYLENSATELWNHAAHDPVERQRLTNWAAAQTKRLIESQHHRLGAMVAASLDSYSDEQLIRGIDDKFGPDLQFIRLNGAVLGFLIGLVLGAGSLFLHK